MKTPDKWVILKIKTEKETFYKVLGGWSGGYLDDSYYRVNSGITKVEDKEDHYLFHGYSGSIYKCNKKCYGVNNIMTEITTQLEDKPNVEILEYQDFGNLLEK